MAWQAIMDGTDPATLGAEAAETLSHDLVSALQEVWDVEDGRIARVLTGRKPTRDEVEAVTEWYWRFEPSHLALPVKETQRVAGEGWRGWLVKKRYEVRGKGGKVRMIGARLPVLLEQEEARALEPDIKRLEKLTR